MRTHTDVRVQPFLHLPRMFITIFPAGELCSSRLSLGKGGRLPLVFSADDDPDVACIAWNPRNRLAGRRHHFECTIDDELVAWVRRTPVAEGERDRARH